MANKLNPQQILNVLENSGTSRIYVPEQVSQNTYTMRRYDGFIVSMDAITAEFVKNAFEGENSDGAVFLTIRLRRMIDARVNKS